MQHVLHALYESTKSGSRVHKLLSPTLVVWISSNFLTSKAHMTGNDNSDILHNGGLEGLVDYKVFRRRYPARSSLPVRFITDWCIQEIPMAGKKFMKWICICGIYKDTVIRTSAITSIITSRKICTSNCIYMLGSSTRVLENSVCGIERYFVDGFPENWESIVEKAFSNPNQNVHGVETRENTTQKLPMEPAVVILEANNSKIEKQNIIHKRHTEAKDESANNIAVKDIIVEDNSVQSTRDINRSIHVAHNSQDTQDDKCHVTQEFRHGSVTTPEDVQIHVNQEIQNASEPNPEDNTVHVLEDLNNENFDGSMQNDAVYPIDDLENSIHMLEENFIPRSSVPVETVEVSEFMTSAPAELNSPLADENSIGTVSIDEELISNSVQDVNLPETDISMELGDDPNIGTREINLDSVGNESVDEIQQDLMNDNISDDNKRTDEQTILEINNLLSSATVPWTQGIDDEFENYDKSLLEDIKEPRRGTPTPKENKYMSVADFVNMTSPFKLPPNMMPKKSVSQSPNSSIVVEAENAENPIAANLSMDRPIPQNSVVDNGKVSLETGDIETRRPSIIPETCEVQCRPSGTPKVFDVDDGAIIPASSPVKTVVDLYNSNRTTNDLTLQDDLPVKKVRLSMRSNSPRASLSMTDLTNEKICDEYFERIKIAYSDKLPSSPIKSVADHSEHSIRRQSVLEQIESEMKPTMNPMKDTSMENANDTSSPPKRISLVRDAAPNLQDLRNTSSISSNAPLRDEQVAPAESHSRDVANLSDVSSSTRNGLSFKRPSIKVLKSIPTIKANSMDHPADKKDAFADSLGSCDELEPQTSNSMVAANIVDDESYNGDQKIQEDSISGKNSSSRIKRRTVDSDSDDLQASETVKIKRGSLSDSSGTNKLPMKNISSLDSNAYAIGQDDNKSFTKSKKKKTILVMPRRLKSLTKKLKRK